MGQVIPVVNSFEGGMKTDPPIDDMPHGSFRRFKDFLPPEVGVSDARKRGGWAYGSKDLNAVHAIGRVSAVAWAPFNFDAHLVAIGPETGAGAQGHGVFQIKTPFDTTAGTYISEIFIPGAGSGPEIAHQPVWHQSGKALIIVSSAQNLATSFTPVKYYDTGGLVYGTANLGGTPPLATVVASYGDYLILANGYVGGVRFNNRMWFSDVGAFETWNTGTSYLDLPEEILAVVPKGNIIFVFGPSGTHIITGDTPPPGGNFSVRKFAFAQGTIDARSVTTYKDYVIWANKSGVWRSDGSQPVDLTRLGGIASWWHWITSTADAPNYFSCETYQNYLIVSVSFTFSGTLSYWATMVYDMERNTWTEWQNITAIGLAKAPSTSVLPEEVFFAHGAAGRVGKLSTCWSPGAGGFPFGDSTDADGSTVTPSLITGAYRLGSYGYKRIRRAFISYSFNTPTAAGVNVVSYTDLASSPGSPASTGFGSQPVQALTPSTGSGSLSVRAPVYVNRRAKTIQFNIAMTGSATDFRLYGVEVEATPHDKVRDGDART